MIKVNEIKLELDAEESELKSRVAKALCCNEDLISNITIAKRAIDSRKKNNIYLVYNLLVEVNTDENNLLKHAKNPKADIFTQEIYSMPENKRTSKFPPVIIGFGPAGLFAGLTLARAGLNPIIFERGADVDERTKHVLKFWQNRKLNTESNVQFGEGGAGTFSDGKLTTGIKDVLVKKVIDEFVLHGAPAEISYSATPHIGTDKLGKVVKNIREEIKALGGKVVFNACLRDIIIANDSVHGVLISENGREYGLETDTLFLCIGHSARDTLEMLYSKGLYIIQKAFSMGVRIEHPRELIDKSQFGEFANHPKLGSAVYKMACHPEHGRGAYTFCMCPGGTVICASSEKETVVVNGMSEYARNGENSNSAVLVGVEPIDFGGTHPLAGMFIQRKIEKFAFERGGNDYTAPCQLVGDFLKRKKSTKLSSVNPSCPTGVMPSDIREILPPKVTDTMADAIIKMDKMLDGFALPDAVLTAPETRSSSPVRILRNDIFQSNIRGIYPCGEGAGYAGGIVSAGVDGIRCAHAVLNDENDEW